MNKINYYISNVSDGNLGLHIGGIKDDIIKNRKILATKLSLSLDNFVFMNQIHSGNIQIIGEDDKGKGIINYKDTYECDSLITKEKGIVIGVLVADCVPVILYDAVKNTIAVVHAGWKGTEKQIVLKTILKMKEYRSSLDDIKIIIGPSISKENYEVGIEVAEIFRKEVRKKRSGKKELLNLKLENKLQALDSGIKIENIEIIDIDTFTDKNYFSARRDGFKKGRFGAFIWINK